MSDITLTHIPCPELGHTIARLSYADGTTYTTSDWQAPQPQTLDEVGDFNWIDEKTGRAAIMIDGLPRVIE